MGPLAFYFCYTQYMKPLKELITADLVQEMASRSHYRYGKQIAKDGEFKVTKENTFNYLAEVKSGNHKPYSVAIMSTTKGFRWKCECSNKKDYFCEHCVALSLHLLEQSQ